MYLGTTKATSKRTRSKLAFVYLEFSSQRDTSIHTQNDRHYKIIGVDMAISFTDCRAVIVQETFKIFAYYKSIHYLFGEMYDFKLIIT